MKLADAKLLANVGNFTCVPHVKRPHTHFICVRYSLPVKIGIFTCVYAASTSHRKHTHCLLSHVNLSGDSGYSIGNFKWITQVKSPTTGMKNFLLSQAKNMQVSAKNIRSRRRKYPQLQARTPAFAVKICASSGKIPTIASKNINISAISGNTAMTTLINSLAICRYVSLHLAGDDNRNLLVLLCSVACILHEVLAGYMQVKLPVFTGKLHVAQVNCVWGLFTCVASHAKVPAFAGNATRSGNHP